jgi:D-beta-D-heptose 7-phosphate kinase/D-beta-D-heptose 1-phosphate adenosyltransferase
MKTSSLNQVIKYLGKNKDKVTVLATGIFDLLHQEHIKFLTKAKQSGDLLIVGVEIDSRVKAIKGKDRPIDNQTKRLDNLSKLESVDKVFLLPQNFNTQQDWENFIQDLRPNIYAVSSHTNWLKNKRLIMNKFGGKVQVVHRHNPKISTTKIIKKRS